MNFYFFFTDLTQHWLSGCFNSNAVGPAFGQRVEMQLPSLSLDVIMPEVTRRLSTSVAALYWNTKVKTVSLNKLNFLLNKTRLELETYWEGKEESQLAHVFPWK